MPSRKGPRTPKPKEEWRLLGRVAVDSGQLLVCDPCYIDSRWVRQREPPGHDPVQLTEAGRKRWPHLVAWRMTFPFPWGTYADPSPDLGMSVSDAVTHGLLEHAPRPPPSGEFSYSGASEASMAKEGGGTLGSYLAVAFSAGYGDGLYDVLARHESESGRVAEVRIVLIDDASPQTRVHRALFGRSRKEGK